LISCPTIISSHNHYYCSQVLSARQLGLAIFLRSLGLLRLALDVLCNLLRLLVIFVEKNTVPAVLRTFSFLPRFACTASCSGPARSTSASLLAPCCGSRLYCASPSRVRQLGLANFLHSLVLLCLTPALRSATSSNGSLSYSLEGIRVQSQQHTQQPATINSDAPPASPRELPARHTSACNDWYMYYTSHSAPLAPLAVLPINQHYKNLHIQTQQLASCYSATLSYTSFPSPSGTCMYKVSSSTFIIHI